MSGRVFESRVWVPRPREEVFAFFTDPRTLTRIMPPRFAVQLLTPPVVIAAGAVLDYRVSVLGVPVRWRAFIREYDPPVRFVDVQLNGPCNLWDHRHLFLEEQGGTWVEDRIAYQLPFGPLGEWAHALFARRALVAVWEYRTRRIGELIGPVSPGPPRHEASRMRKDPQAAQKARMQGGRSPS